MDKVIDVITGGLTTTKVDESQVILWLVETWSRDLNTGLWLDEWFQIRWQNGLVGKLHALTGSLLFLFSITVFAKELLGDHIRCTRLEKNTFCITNYSTESL